MLYLYFLSSCSQYNNILSKDKNCISSTNTLVLKSFKTNKNTILYQNNDVSFSEYLYPPLNFNKSNLAKYKEYTNSNIDKVMEKLLNSVESKGFKITSFNKESNMINTINPAGQHYTIQLSPENSGTVIYIINKENKLVLLSNFPKLMSIFKSK